MEPGRFDDGMLFNGLFSATIWKRLTNTPTRSSWWMTRKRHGLLIINRKFIKRAPLAKDRYSFFLCHFIFFTRRFSEFHRKAAFATCLLLHLYKTDKKQWQGLRFPRKPYLCHFLKQMKIIALLHFISVAPNITSTSSFTFCLFLEGNRILLEAIIMVQIM